MHSLFRKITALLLLVAFMFILAPEYLLHEFTGHHDTIELLSQATTVSSKHVHCESLQLQIQFFTEAENLSLPAILLQRLLLAAAPVKSYFFNNHYYTSPRGPPFIA